MASAARVPAETACSSTQPLRTAKGSRYTLLHRTPPSPFGIDLTASGARLPRAPILTSHHPQVRADVMAFRRPQMRKVVDGKLIGILLASGDIDPKPPLVYAAMHGTNPGMKFEEDSQIFTTLNLQSCL